MCLSPVYLLPGHLDLSGAPLALQVSATDDADGLPAAVDGVCDVVYDGFTWGTGNQKERVNSRSVSSSVPFNNAEKKHNDDTFWSIDESTQQQLICILYKYHAAKCAID